MTYLRFVDRSHDPVAADTRLLPMHGIAVERLLPGVELGDWVFDPEDVHLGSFPLSDQPANHSLV